MDCDNGLDVLSNDGILDVIPPSEYDPFEAKFCASLFWLVFHATEDGGLEDVPSQVTNPVQKLVRCNTFAVHPEIVQFLTKGEVYCMVCSRIFPGRVALAGHWSVIQTLSRNGIYVVDGSTDIAVTDSALEQTNPFNQGSHVALMDALMTAYSSQVVNIQSVVQAVRRFSTFSASRELPFDMEDALLLWVNKLGGAINSKYSKLTSSNSTRKLLRNREQEKKIELHGSIGEETPATSAFIPVIDDLFKGLCDGRCLLAILLFYEPTVIKIEDICADRVLCAEDSIRNLDLFRNLCSQYFCTSVLSLKVEDILYGSPSLKVNLVALLAEMFWKCEGSSKEISEIQRSKTSCSANGERVTNGHDENARSRSAPVSRNELVSGNPAIPGSRHRQFLDKDISLKIQNFVENVGSSVQDIPAGEKHSPEEDVMSLGDGANVEDTMNVGGVVVKLRKKVPRNVESGGGHEALLSRRIKKSLCSQSQEHVSADTTPRTSDPEEQFDAKSDEVYPQQGDFSTEPKEPLYRIMGNDDDVDNVDLTSLKDTPHSFDLDLNLLSEAATPLDQLSPISETTEPGSLGNSLNGSVTSPRDPPISVDSSALRHQPVEKNRELGPDRFTPPFSRSPRKLSHENQSLTEESSAPRGSYVITGVTHTAESAVAAGIPIVERESLRMSGTLSRHARSDANRSSDAALLFRSSFAAGQTAEAGSEIASPKKTPTASSQSWRGEVNGSLEYATVSDQRYSSEEHRPERRNDSRFSTFTKEKTTDEHKTNAPTYSLKTVEKKSENDRNLLTFSKNSAGGNAVVGRNTVEDDLPGRKNEMSEPPITWFVHRKPEPSSLKEDISKSVETVDHVPQRTVVESSGKTTNWALAARDSEPVEKEPGDLVDKSGGVSRELNLLRLKLAEKQRDIEAQKRRTKEQLEEERRRFGQNVFWFAVGKERQKKEANEIKPPNKTRDIKRVEQPLPSNSRTTLTSSHAEPCQKNKYITFTKQSSLDEDLPPSMGKLQDRTYNLKAVDENLRGSKDDLVPHTESPMVLPNQASPIVHEFRLSRQTSGSQQPLLEKVQSPSKSGFPGNSNGFQVDSEKQRAPVMNYKSRISVPLTYPTKTVSENSSDVDNLGILSTSLDAPGLVDRPSNQAASPPRKCWDTDALNQDEPQFAVSKSNYHIFEQSRVIEGSGDNYESRQSNSRNDVDDQWTTREMYSKNMNAVVGEDNPDGPKSLIRFNDGRQTSSEVHVFDNKGSPEECQAIFEANGNSPANSGNSPSSENGDEGPKKGLALFIGEQNSAGENGLTPEQLKKRERFLKNRQQKMEEEKIKKEAILEKKRRKEEKMKEIELRRQKEERERQARLQQKKEQAELAKQERQKYEMRRKENLPRSNIVDGIPSGYSGFARTDVNPPTLRPAAEELSGFGVNGPVSTPSPSAFAGFTGVQSYVKPSGKTNRKLIINAISYVCLPGAVNKDTKDKCLQAMTESSAQHFLILFREGLKFRGLYSFDLENNQVLKVYGVGPRSVTKKMIERLYKYNSGGKEFSEIPAKGFSLSVDGFTLQKSCWQSSKPSVPSKTVSNYKSSTFRPTR